MKKIILLVSLLFTCFWVSAQKPLDYCTRYDLDGSETLKKLQEYCNISDEQLRPCSTMKLKQGETRASWFLFTNNGMVYDYYHKEDVFTIDRVGSKSVYVAVGDKLYRFPNLSNTKKLKEILLKDKIVK